MKEKAIARRLVQSATEIVTSVYEENKDIEQAAGLNDDDPDDE